MTRPGLGAVAWVLSGLLLGVGSAAEPRPLPPAPGGAPLLAASETGTATVAGTVGPAVRLDVRGLAAELAVERVLAGTIPTGSHQRIAWEEISPQRPLRFPEGARLVVALEPLPSGSLWRGRFPEGGALAVAARGNAFLREPDTATLDALAAYLALESPVRSGAPGASALLALAADGHPSLAAAALSKLDAIQELDARLTGAGRDHYSRLLGDAGRPRSLRIQALGLAGRRPLRSLRNSIAPFATPGSSLEAPALAAIAQIEGGLSKKTVESLLLRSEAAIREVAVRFSREGIGDARLAALMQEDPAPEVRAAAFETLIERRGSAALESALPMLFDPDQRVTRTASLGIASLGSEAVPKLRRLLEQRPFDQPRELAPAAFAMAMAGPEGRRALVEIAASHPDARVRGLAELALGRFSGDSH
jgi:hypothetical protein